MRSARNFTRITNVEIGVIILQKMPLSLRLKFVGNLSNTPAFPLTSRKSCDFFMFEPNSYYVQIYCCSIRIIYSQIGCGYMYSRMCREPVLQLLKFILKLYYGCPGLARTHDPLEFLSPKLLRALGYPLWKWVHMTRLVQGSTPQEENFEKNLEHFSQSTIFSFFLYFL